MVRVTAPSLYRRLAICSGETDGKSRPGFGGLRLAVTGGQRDELVEARADAILASAHTAGAYAEHFDAQMHAGESEAQMGPRRCVSCSLRCVYSAAGA